MSSKSRGGLSKREYSAKQSGGTLNYKTGKISTPKKSSYKSSSSKKSSSGSYNQNQYTAYKMADKLAGTNMAETYAKAYGASSSLQGPLTKEGSFYPNESKDSDRNKKIRNDRSVATPVSNNRTTAAKAQNPSYSGGTTKPNIVASNPTKIGKGLQWANEALGYGYGKLMGSEDPMLGLTQQLMGGDWGLSELIPGANAMMRDNPATGGWYKDPNVSTAINYNEIGTPAETRAASQQEAVGNVPTTNYPSVYNTRQNPTPTRPQPQPTSTPGISNPFNIPSPFIPESGISSAYDNTPIAPNNGTVQRPVGMGQFSNGWAANGAGGYGLGGGYSSGNAMGNEQNILDELLLGIGGIPTANAQEIQGDSEAYPGLTFEPGTPNTYDAAQLLREMNLGMMDNSWNQDQKQINQELADANLPQEPEDMNSVLQQLISMAGLGNTAQASGNTGLGATGLMGTGEGESSSASDDSTFKKQKKSAEKANKEYLKSLDREYAEAKTSGTADLEKAKQQDLLKLGAQFNFANSDPNDEQRIQYQGRTTSDYAGQVVDLIKKLASAKASDKSTAYQKLQEVLMGIQQAKQAQQEKVAEIQRQQQQQRFSNLAALYRLQQSGGGYDTGSGEVDIWGNPV